MTDELSSLKLTSLETSIRELRSTVSRLADAVSEAVAQQKTMQGELADLRKQVSGYIAEDRLARDEQFAQTALIDIRAQLDREFGQHRAVQRSVIGMLKAIDAGTVTRAALQRTAERLAVDVPGYWLALAQLAVAAWVRDSPDDARRAVREAVHRDRAKAALFFGLVTARFGCEDAAGRWICEHLSTLDCRSLSGEFAELLDAIARGALGRPASDRAEAACLSWRKQLSQSRDLTRQQTASWRSFIGDRRQSPRGEFSLLPKITAGADWKKKLDWLDGATAFGQTEHWLTERLAHQAAGGEEYSAVIDGLLSGLVGAHSPGEASLLQLARRWQTVIRRPADDEGKAAAGPAEKATAAAERADALGRPDFLTLLTGLATGRTGHRVAALTARFALALCGDFVAEAVGGLRDVSLRGQPDFIEVDIDGWRYAIRPGDDARRLEQEYSQFVDRELQKDIERAKVPWRARRETVQSRWEARRRDGLEAIPRAVTEVNWFFARWQRESASAQRCIDLVRAEPAGGRGSAPSSAAGTWAAGPERGSLGPPGWDLLPAPDSSS